MVHNTRTILIIDDSPEDRELYRRYLLQDSEYSYEILEAGLGELGLELWQRNQPDAVLLDYRLPDFDGIEFLTEMSRQTQQQWLPVIMVTGQGNEQIAVQVMKAGVQDYLVKEQITAQGLQLAISRAIETVQLKTQLQQHVERERLVSQMTRKIHQSLDLEEILQTTVTQVRQFLQSDRVLIFRLQSDGLGIVSNESVSSQCAPLLSTSLYDPCLKENYLELFRQGLVTAKGNIYDGSIKACHVELLEKLNVRANLVVPILQDNQLWGMLIAHHCATPRQWQPLEIDLLKELATQVEIALQQAELYQQAQTELAERRRTEAALRKSEERFRQLAENIDAAFWVTELPERRVSYVSPAYERLWGLNRQDLYNDQQNWINMLHPEDREVTERTFQQKLVEGGRFDQEYRIILPDGRMRWVRDRCFPLYDESGRIYRLTGIAEDITDRKEAQMERDLLLEKEQLARSQAEDANRIKDEFLAIVSHELRSPLNPILGWSRLLQTRKLGEVKTREALATIERNVKLQTQLIDDLLDVARILRGKLSLNAVPVNLTLIIESAIETVRTAAIAKSILIHPVLPNVGEVWGDSTRLQQIVWNLLSNAIKFTPEHGRVSVYLEQIDGLAQITVTDTGKGISPEFLPHIFEYFRQEDSSITRQYGGLGLGLAIVRSLVEAHGGTIGAASPGVGEGAIFIIRLPLLSTEVQSDRSNGSKDTEIDLTGVRVLLVDDDPDNRELLAFIFNEYGAQTMATASASEVLACLETFKPDILISDIGMPETDGYVLLRQLRSRLPAQGGVIPAIAITAYAKQEDRERALLAGFQEHISKPVEPRKLVEAVVNLLIHR
jgi:PAS domain S-box-containing protein